MKTFPLTETADAPEDQQAGRSMEYAGNRLTASGKIRKEITSLAELLAFFEVDEAEWEVERWLCNQWQMAAKTDDGIEVTPLYQVKAWFKRRVALISAKSDLAEALAAAQRTLKSAPRLPAPKKARRLPKKEYLFVPSIMDPHFGKLCWGRETGWENYDVRIASRLVLEAAADLVRKAAAYDFREIVFPVGNDFFHVDNSDNTTRKGTPQDVDGRWFRAYQGGREVVMQVIAALAEIAPVKVVIVRGNHDEDRILTLGDCLDVAFRNEKWITVDCGQTMRKYHAFGTTLLGFEHGILKLQRLLGMMPIEAREQWGAARHCEWICGHLHQKREVIYQPVSEDRGLRVRTIPSLTSADFWHANQGYVGAMRAAEGLVYHERLGYEAQFSYTPGR